MKLVVTPSQQEAARLKLRLADDLTAEEARRLTAVANARRISQAELAQLSETGQVVDATPDGHRSRR